MTVVREGKVAIFLAGALASMFIGLGLVFNWDFIWFLLAISGVAGVLSFLIFRDPRRSPPSDTTLVVSPADGRVVALEPISDPYVGERAVRISIFLTLFDAHVNRCPCSGSVENTVYSPGAFHPAFDPRSPGDNEHTVIDIQNSRFRVRFKQIAGFLTRRIVNNLKPGETVRVGDRMGMIIFGSRVEVVLPREMMTDIELRQQMRAGETVIGKRGDL